MVMRKDIVYITSDTRSGSTLLSILLGRYQGVTTVGELRFLWNYYNKYGTGNTRDWRCTCGLEIKECDFWGSIINNEISALLGNTENAPETARVLNKIYDRIIEKYSIKYIVDSSKSVWHLINMIRFRDRYKVIFIIRDIRGTAYSKYKRNSLPIVKGMLLWIKKNLEILFVLKIYNVEYIKITYEDLCRDRKTHESVLEFLGGNFIQPQNDSSISHDIAGSSRRFSFEEISYDDSYKSKYIGLYRTIYQLFFMIINKILLRSK